MSATNLPFWRDRTPEHAQRYWETRAAPYRGLLADALRPLTPFDSVLEIGCHSGPNLWAIRQKWPDAVLYGIDPALSLVCSGAKTFANPTAATHTDLLGVCFMRGEAPSCFGPAGVEPIVLSESGDVICGEPCALPDEVGVIVTCYTLAYLTEPQLDETLVHMMRIATRGLVLVEPQPDDWQAICGGWPSSAMPTTLGQVQPYHHDYLHKLHTAGWTVTSRPFPGPDNLNAILVATR